MRRVAALVVRSGIRSLAALRAISPIVSGPRIITYHSIRADDAGRQSAYVQKSDFEVQLRWLIANGFEVVSMSKLLDALQMGGPMPDNWICITFDDGYSDTYSTAFPILQSHSMLATVFLISGKVDREPGFLRTEQIREMHRYGFEFGAHTVDHLSLTSVPRHLARDQVFGSRSQLEDGLGISVNHFCYPYGHFDAVVEEFVREAGYSTCCTEYAGPITSDTDPFHLLRIGVLGTDTTGDFSLRVRGAYDWWVNAYVGAGRWRGRRRKEMDT